MGGLDAELIWEAGFALDESVKRAAAGARHKSPAELHDARCTAHAARDRDCWE